MSRIARLLAKEISSRTPGLRRCYFRHLFLDRPPSYFGIYPSFATAAAASPRRKLAGYDHPEIARLHEADPEELNPADYPVLFWLGKLLPGTRAVFDLGGNIGLAWYAYRRYVDFPAGLTWTVCEVPATVAAGTELARKRGATGLRFTDRREEADGADLYFTAGALQYIEEPLAAILGALSRRPRHLLIQRVPLTDGAPFITLQNSGLWTSPYRVDNRDEFVRSLAALGYGPVDEWKTGRTLEVPMSPEHRAEFRGMYLRLRA